MRRSSQTRSGKALQLPRIQLNRGLESIILKFHLILLLNSKLSEALWGKNVIESQETNNNEVFLNKKMPGN